MIWDEIEIKGSNDNWNPKTSIIEIDELKTEYIKFTYKHTGHQETLSLEDFREWMEESYIKHTLISFEWFTKKDD